MPSKQVVDSARPGLAIDSALALPGPWAARLEGYTLAAETIGCSGAAVFRAQAPGRPSMFLKTERAGPFAELEAEADRLRWLAAHGVPAPQVLDQLAGQDRLWLLTAAVPGRNLAVSELAPEAVVALVAGALRDLHGRDARDCPFDHRLEQRLKLAGMRLQAGLVDEGDFEEEWLGRSAADLFEELLALRPDDDEDLVLTHGDACLPNLIQERGEFTGFVDCGRAGLGDRRQDLALAARSISSNLGPEWGEAFLTAYGVKPDHPRLAYYRLLDEFF